MPIRLVPSLLFLLSSGCFVSSAGLEELRQDAVDHVDADGDGLAVRGDCDDSDPGVGEPTTFYADSDGDGAGNPAGGTAEACELPEGYSVRADDCDDSDDRQSPFGDDVPDDGIDQDCSGSDTRQCYLDRDHDGWGTSITATLAFDGSCDKPDGEAEEGGDCADDDAGRFPGNPEIPGDGIDQDCDFADSVFCFADADGDGFGDPEMPLPAADCWGWGATLDATDCDDTDYTVHPFAYELCDGQVNACGGALPDVETDGDGDLYIGCAIDPDGWDGDPSVIGWGDCDPTDGTVHPLAPSRCDGKINWCGTSLASDEVDDDNDGYVECVFAPGVTASNWANAEVPAVTGGSDCNDLQTRTFPGAPEVCDGKVNTCGGSLPADEIDDDNDGRVECAFAPGVTPANWGYPEWPAVVSDRDCDDALARTWPGAPEFCDGLDNDCDAQGDVNDAVGRISLERTDGTWVDVAANPAMRTSLTFTSTSNGTLWFCPGTHYVSLTLSLAASMGIVGRYGPSVTTLSGRLPPPSSTPSARILDIASAGDVRVEGLTLEGGFVSTSGGGAIIFEAAGDYEVTNCVLRDNAAPLGGAMFATYGATVDVSDTTVTDNEANRGGALFVYDADVAITGATVVYNTATTYSGGAIHLGKGTVTVDDTTLMDNVSLGGSGLGGGAISMSDGTLTITDSELVGNEAPNNDGGAILVLPGGSPVIYLEDSTVQDNAALGWGGGIACRGPCELVAIDTYVSGNVASTGGGVMLADALARFTCTATSANAGGVVSNDATTAGGGVQINASGATVTSTRCNWGAAGTLEQNAPTDVSYPGGSTNYAGDASFACSYTGCASSL